MSKRASWNCSVIVSNTTPSRSRIVRTSSCRNWLDLNAAATKAKTKRIKRQTEDEQLKGIENDRGALDTFPAILSNRFIQEIKADLSRLQAEHAQLAKKLGEKHPDMIKVTSAIDSPRPSSMPSSPRWSTPSGTIISPRGLKEQSLSAALRPSESDALAQNRKGSTMGCWSAALRPTVDYSRASCSAPKRRSSQENSSRARSDRRRGRGAKEAGVSANEA